MVLDYYTDLQKLCSHWLLVSSFFFRFNDQDGWRNYVDSVYYTNEGKPNRFLRYLLIVRVWWWKIYLHTTTHTLKKTRFLLQTNYFLSTDRIIYSLFFIISHFWNFFRLKNFILLFKPALVLRNELERFSVFFLNVAHKTYAST